MRSNVLESGRYRLYYVNKAVTRGLAVTRAWQSPGLGSHKGLAFSRTHFIYLDSWLPSQTRQSQGLGIQQST